LKYAFLKNSIIIFRLEDEGSSENLKSRKKFRLDNQNAFFWPVTVGYLHPVSIVATIILFFWTCHYARESLHLLHFFVLKREVF